MSLSSLASSGMLLVLLVSCRPTLPVAPDPSVRPLGSEPAALQGVVLSVERPRPEDSQAYVHVVFAPADQQPIRLALAPGWYLDQQGIRYDPNEHLSVQGQRVVEGGKSTLVVRQVQQGDRSYLLRDEQGKPAWLKP